MWMSALEYSMKKWSYKSASSWDFELGIHNGTVVDEQARLTLPV